MAARVKISVEQNNMLSKKVVIGDGFTVNRWQLIQKIQVQFPASQGSSWLTLTPIPGDLMPSSGLLWILHTYNIMQTKHPNT